jgi:hypothetical protein
MYGNGNLGKDRLEQISVGGDAPHGQVGAQFDAIGAAAIGGHGSGQTGSAQLKSRVLSEHEVLASRLLVSVL